MLDSHKPYTFDRVVRLSLSAAIIWAVFSLAAYLSDVLLPFAAALVLAYMVNPLVELVQKPVKSRPAAVFITMVVVTVVLLALGWFLIPMVGSELSRMGSALSELVNNSEIAKRAANRLPPDLWQAIRDFAARDDVRQFFSQNGLDKMIGTAAQKALPGIWKIVSGTANVLFAVAGLLVVVLYLVFILMDFGKFRNRWQEWIPETYRENVVEFFNDFTEAMNCYFRTQILIALIMAAVFATGFKLIGLPLAVVLGLFTGLLNIVPYLQIVGLAPAFMLAGIDAILNGHGFLYGMALVGGVFAIAQVFQDGFLVPKMQGKAMGLSPWLILLSLSIWGKLLGFLGLIIALPMTVLCLAYYNRYLVQKS